VRNIFLFIRRYFNFLFFLLLQGSSIYLIVHYNRYQKAMFTATANQVTGAIDKEFDKISSYINLKKTNASLVKGQEELYNKLKQDFQLPDTSGRFVVDTFKVDSLEQYRRYKYYNAKVVANSVSAQNNYIVLSRGANQQVREGMGIIDPNNGVVGIVTETSGDFAVVMSLLHKDSHISGKLATSGETGTLSWDGKTPNIITLNGIPKSAKVSKGDTIITSGFSTSLPKGMMVGFVTDVIAEQSTSNYTIKLKTAANFYNLEYVFAIENKQADEVNKLLDHAKKQTQ
jgi:rod shape-determining protein MreC